MKIKLLSSYISSGAAWKTAKSWKCHCSLSPKFSHVSLFMSSAVIFSHMYQTCRNILTKAKASSLHCSQFGILALLWCCCPWWVAARPKKAVVGEFVLIFPYMLDAQICACSIGMSKHKPDSENRKGHRGLRSHKVQCFLQCPRLSGDARCIFWTALSLRLHLGCQTKQNKKKQLPFLIILSNES